jgi:hypothetical protein
VTIGGEVENPQVTVVANLEYNPIVLSGQILESVDFKGKVFNDSVEISDAEINGTATFSGDIKGVGNNTITIESVADLMNTINYEIVCTVGKRVPRVYIRDNKTVNVLNYLV